MIIETSCNGEGTGLCYINVIVLKDRRCRMFAVRGIYKDEKVIIQEEIKTEKPVNVIVTFLEEVKVPVAGKLDMEKFSFKKSRELLASYKGSLSDAIVEERRSDSGCAD